MKLAPVLPGKDVSAMKNRASKVDSTLHDKEENWRSDQQVK